MAAAETETAGRRAGRKTLKKVVLIAALALALAVSGALAFSAVYFSSHVAPGTTLAGLDVGGADRESLARVVREAFAEKRVRVVLAPEGGVDGNAGLDAYSGVGDNADDATDADDADNADDATDASDADDAGMEALLSFEELGVSMDLERTLDATFAGGGVSFFRKLNPYVEKRVPLAFDYDELAVQTALGEVFAGKLSPVKEPSVRYSKKTGKFKARQGNSGRSLEAEGLLASVKGDALTGEASTATAVLRETTPATTWSVAKQTARTLNRMLETEIDLIYEEETVYRIPKEKIASWLTASTDGQQGALAPSIRVEKIKEYIEEDLPEKLESTANEEIFLVAKGGARDLIQAGKDGRRVTDMSGVYEEVVGALEKAKAKKVKPGFETLPYERRTIESAGEKWVEVDLGSQTTTLWSGEKKLRTFTVSTGKAKTPTIQGTFRVYLKRDDHTMRGGNKAEGTDYAVPHVRWITYFKGGYAFHAAYWHNAFGTPVSHGCVNMRTPEAKILYDFAPMGTKVVVHG
ncbi:MAG: L,D-transpeptidase [Clostridiales Family XIII bacterium]|jgi:lipoprotein-anchoring transpeptidase ErfK/SrfK|nr:L,D-transpeptidase [Clostridiales Family XIII bacterium]